MMTKKYLSICCLITAVILLFSSLPGAAALDIPDAEQAMRDYFGSSFDETCFHIAGESKGAVVCTYYDQAEYKNHYGLVAVEKLGGYILTSTPCFRMQGTPFSSEYSSDNQIGIFVVKDGSVSFLRSAYENGTVDIAEVAAMQFAGYDLTIGKTDGSLTPKEAICTKYFDEFNTPENCPIFYYHEEDKQFEEYTLCKFLATEQGYCTPAFHVMTSCGYLMQAEGLPPYKPAAFVIKDSNVYTFEEAYNQKLFNDIDAVAKQCNMQKIGDCDNDRQITVKDVLYLQKYIAKIVPTPEVYSYGGEYILDFDGDTHIGMQDVTAMQKLIAKIS